MFRSFSTALSALAAHTTALDVVGNNLANLNTVGFKASGVSFRDLVSLPTGSSASEPQVGMGTTSPVTSRNFVQGSVEPSTGLQDCAIQGEGFFVLKDGSGRNLFTRAGDFHLDAAGRLVSTGGARVQGWMGAEAAGEPSDLSVALGSLGAPVPTTKISIDANLDAGAAARASTTDPYTYTVPMEVFDSQGGAHALSLSFTTKGPGAGGFTTWDISAAIDGSAQIAIPGGSLTFGGAGQLAPPVTTLTIPVQTFADGAVVGPLEWEIANGPEMPRITQYSTASATAAVNQDGKPPAQITGLSIGDGGVLLARDANGRDIPVGLIALAQIANPDTMVAVGDNNLMQTGQTGPAVIGAPGTGGRGRVVGGSLESSTVDMAREFTNLITYQRGYQANSKVITAADELTEEALSLKR